MHTRPVTAYNTNTYIKHLDKHHTITHQIHNTPIIFSTILIIRLRYVLFPTQLNTKNALQCILVDSASKISHVILLWKSFGSSCAQFHASLRITNTLILVGNLFTIFFGHNSLWYLYLLILTVNRKNHFKNIYVH